MRSHETVIETNERVASGIMRLRLHANALVSARPGQWIAIAQPGGRQIIPSPLSLSGLDARGGVVEILYHDGHPLAPWLSLLRPDATLSVLGPWGRPFPYHNLSRHAVLVGAGTRLIGLLALASMLAGEGVSVVVIHDAQTADELLPPSLLPALIELQVATADGTAGSAGSALDLLPPLLSWADALYAALPVSEYPRLKDAVHRHRLSARRGFAHVLVEAPMACFAGACDGCVVSLRSGYGLVCRDGPAFDLLSLA